MILKETQILEFYNNPDPLIEQAKKEHKNLLMHVHGIGVAEHLAQVQGIENKDRYQLRKKYARSNKDLFASLLRHADKVFSAKGSTFSVGLKTDSEKGKFVEYLNDIKNGINLDKWLENIWLDKYATDPNGVILVEHKEGNPYPTYKSILTIRDYKQNGQGLDYIIFEPFKKVDDPLDYVRVYDDEGDRLYTIAGEDIQLVEDTEKTIVNFDNPWGYVPAVLCSDLINPVTEFKKSSIYEQIELAEEYLRDNSIKSIYKKLHGFPIFWMYAPTCKECGGLGFNQGNVCPVCKGSKHSISRDVSDITYLKQPDSTESPTIAPNIAGYVSPDLETLTAMTDELTLLNDAITFGHWGTIIRTEDIQQTATEVFINAQPVEERLNKYSDSYEIIKKFVIDMLGEYLFGDKYEGTSFNAGRNYIVKGMNQIVKEYEELKTSKVGEILMNSKLKEIIRAKYANDSTAQEIASKLMEVEPFVHLTIIETKELDLPRVEYLRKVYFSEWRNSKEDDYLFRTNIDNLKKELTEFTNQKMQENA